MNKMVTPASTAVARRRAAARRRVRRASDSRSTVRMGAAGVAAVGSIEQSPVSPRYGQKRQSDSANHIDQADDLGRGGAPASQPAGRQGDRSGHGEGQDRGRHPAGRGEAEVVAERGPGRGPPGYVAGIDELI